MSDQSSVPRNAPQSPRVIEVEPAEELARLRVEPAPQIIATERTERIVPSEPANLPAVAGAPARRRDRVVTLALAGAGGGLRRLACGRRHRLDLRRVRAQHRPGRCSRPPRSRPAWPAPAR